MSHLRWLTLTCILTALFAGRVAADGAKPDETPAQPKVEGNTLVFDGGERLDLEKQVLILQGRICLQKGPIELFACAPGGKDHESIVLLDCKPQNVHLALISLGLRDRSELGEGGPKYLGDPTRPVGDRVVVELEFEKDGKTQRVRAEDLVLNLASNQPMDRAGWVFTGSSFAPELDPETGKPTGRKVYLANRYRSLITTYHDHTTLIDNPTLDGGNDELFVANSAALPPAGTAARVFIRVPTEEEAREMERLEQEVAKRYESAPEDAPKTPDQPEQK